MRLPWPARNLRIKLAAPTDGFATSATTEKIRTARRLRRHLPETAQRHRKKDLTRIRWLSGIPWPRESFHYSARIHERRQALLRPSATGCETGISSGRGRRSE